MYTRERYRSIGLLLIVILCLAASQLFMAPRVTFAQDNNKDVAAQVLTLVNNWRIQEGLWPYKVNPTLEEMALAQAKYILPKLDSIQDESDYHKDDQGRMPQQRAAQSYGWPSYGNPNQIEVGENAAIGTVPYALQFWHDSPIHKRAALSFVYREVGIAVLPYQRSYLIIMDMGARPGVLPAFVNQAGDTLYPTDERSRYSALKADGTQVRIFDTQGKALTKATPWKQTIDLPKGLEGNIFVLYTNGTFQSMTEVTLTGNSAVPPTTQPVEQAAVPTTVPEATQAATQVDETTVAPTEQASQPTATPIPTTPSEPATLVLLYDKTSLVIYNTSGAKIDLSRFSLGSSVGKVSIDSFGKVAPIPVKTFPVAGCLQIAINSVDPNTPSVCKGVRAQLILGASNVFWKDGTFTVKQGSTIVAICQADTGRCEIAWSQSNE